MNLESLALWLGQGFLHDQMVDKFWMFPMMETFHFIGLSFMFGALLVIDGRVLGIGKFISMKEAMKFIQKMDRYELSKTKNIGLYDKLKIFYAQKFEEETKETIPVDVYEPIEEVACSRLVHRVILNLLHGLEKPQEP
jgi:hypothetical protein